VRFFTSVISKCLNVNTGEDVTQSMYRDLLSEGNRLDMHCRAVDKMIDTLIEKKSRKAHVDFDEVKETVLEDVNVKEKTKKHGGFDFLSLADYKLEFGERILTEKGHYTWTNEDQIDGVAMPDKVIRYDNIERQQAVRRTVIGKSNDECASLDAAMGLRQKVLVNNAPFGPGASSHSGLSTLLGAAAGNSEGASSNAVQAEQASALATAGTAAVVAAPPSARRAATTPAAKCSVAKAKAGSRRVAKAAGAPIAAPASSGRGRPKKDLIQEVMKLRNEFRDAPRLDPLWWGKEVKAKLKELGGIEKQLVDRVAVLTENDEIRPHQTELKALQAIMQVATIFNPQAMVVRDTSK